MSKNSIKIMTVILGIILICATVGCSQKEEAPAPAKSESASAPAPASDTALNAPTQQQTAPPAVESPAAEEKPKASEPVKKVVKQIAVSVDGAELSKQQLNREINKRMNLYKDKIPADKKDEVQSGLKTQLVEEFILKTLLIKEVKKEKITVSKEDIQEAMDQIKVNIPPGKTLEAFLKENNISKEDIVLGIKIKKLVDKEAGSTVKPSAEEIDKFYKGNIDKFTTPETVHVRHILVTIDPKADEKTKAEKKAKIENLRKQVVEGADFADVAQKNSDCPSKENGGDLGEISKGQTVKPFEDAAFSQEVNAIGPVVSTEYGHHVIQVLKHNPGKTVKLEEVKDKIALYLEQKKQSETFGQLTERLKKNAKIVVYDK